MKSSVLLVWLNFSAIQRPTAAKIMNTDKMRIKVSDMSFHDDNILLARSRTLTELVQAMLST